MSSSLRNLRWMKMIRVEKIGDAFDVQIRVEEYGNIIKEYALITMALMNEVPFEKLHAVFMRCAAHKGEIKELHEKQAKAFNLRLMHILELNSLTIDELFREIHFSDQDKEDLKAGTIPSIEGLDKIVKRFGMSVEYFLGADKE